MLSAQAAISLENATLYTDLEGKVEQLPRREDVVVPIQESYIVEFCSR